MQKKFVKPIKTMQLDGLTPAKIDKLVGRNNAEQRPENLVTIEAHFPGFTINREKSTLNFYRKHDVFLKNDVLDENLENADTVIKRMSKRLKENRDASGDTLKAIIQEIKSGETNTVNERTINLDTINPIEFFGNNNGKLEILKKKFPQLKILSRGTQVKMSGAAHGLEEASNKIGVVVQRIQKDGRISEKDFESVMYEVDEKKELRVQKKIQYDIILPKDPRVANAMFGPDDIFLEKIREHYQSGELDRKNDKSSNRLIVRDTAATTCEKIDKICQGLQKRAESNGDVYESDLNEIITEVDSVNKIIPVETLWHDNSNDVLVYGPHGKKITARTNNQRKMVKAADNNDIIFATGPAGTGKTYTAVALAVRALQKKEVKKIILTRPAVEAGESLGFLPGDLKEKVDPYLRPLYDALDDMIEPEKLGYYMSTRTIEIAPLAYMRGRTLDNAFVILDEAQNASETQMKMFLTRIGANGKALITGDSTQIDLPRNQRSGLADAKRRLQDIDGIAQIELDEEDVVRHRLVKEIIKAYNLADDEITQDSRKGERLPIVKKNQPHAQPR